MVRVDLTWIYGWVPDVLFLLFGEEGRKEGVRKLIHVVGKRDGRKCEKAHVVWKRDGWMDGWMDGWVYRRTMGELNEEKKKYLVSWLGGFREYDTIDTRIIH